MIQLINEQMKLGYYRETLLAGIFFAKENVEIEV